jgi:hypothetical protein
MRSPDERRVLVRALGRPLARTLAAAAAVVATSMLLAGVVLAASPSPSAQAGDPRSSGQGPGLVGDPLFAIAVVVAIGILSLAATLVYVRATGGTRGAGGRG